MVEHLGQRLPEEFEVFIVEARLPGKMRADEPVATVETIGNEVLAAHGLIGRVGFLGIGHRHTRDANIQRKDRIHRTAETQLHRPSHLSGVCTRGHDRSKGTHVEVPFAHSSPRIADLFAACLLGFCVHIVVESFVGVQDPVIQNLPLLHEDVIASDALLSQQHKVAHLAFEAHIRDQPTHVLRIHAWGIRGVRIAVGVAVLAVEEINEVVTVVHDWEREG